MCASHESLSAYQYHDDEMSTGTEAHIVCASYGSLRGTAVPALGTTRDNETNRVDANPDTPEKPAGPARERVNIELQAGSLDVFVRSRAPLVREGLTA